MKLKTRIFTLVTSLFLGSFVISAVLQNLLSNNLVSRTNNFLDNALLSNQEKQQKLIQNHIVGHLNEELAIIEAILNSGQDSSYWSIYFSPTTFNVNTNLWYTSSLFLMSNKSIDLIETQINDKLTSHITLDEPPRYKVHVLDFLDQIKISVIDTHEPGVKLQGPYIAIPFDYNEQVLPGNSPTKIHYKNYLLYTPEQVMTFDGNLFNQNIQDFINLSITDKNASDYPMSLGAISELKKVLPEIHDYLLKTQNYLKSNPNLYTYITDQKTNWIYDQFSNFYDVVSGENEYFDEPTILNARYDQIKLIVFYNSLTATGAYQYQMSDKAPIGVTNIKQGEKEGFGIRIKDVFSEDPVDILAKSIFRDAKGRIFLGDTRKIRFQTSSGMNETSITVGQDIHEFLEGIANITEKNCAMVVNNEIIFSSNQNGDPITINKDQFPLDQILSSVQGRFEGENKKEFIFFTNKLIPDQNVYLIFYSPRDEEFAFVNSFGERLVQLRTRITIQNAIIALITLLLAAFLISRLSSYITNPISILAKNSREVQEGHLEDVSLPEMEDHPEDEIEDLYHSFSDMVKGLKEKEKVKGILNKVVSPQIANKILEGSVTLGGEEKIVTVLFADIRHFTALTEKMPPKELIEILNSYMTKLSDVIDRHNGVIDKYVGDEVMALFGAPISDQECAAQAVSCAIEMMREVDLWNQDRLNLNLLPIEIGIGIHTGNVVAGNVGAENRLNYTVLGANVNLAARLCSAAQPKQILISEETLNFFHVKDLIDVKPLEPISLKGFSAPVPVYQVIPKTS